MSKVFAYGRASTDKQSLTEQVQKQKCRDYIKASLGEHKFAGWYYDAATSSRKPMLERDKGREILVLAQPGDHVVWAKLDRAFRSVLDGANTLLVLESKGVHIHSMDVGLDTTTPIGKCIMHILLAFAELEREQISQRTKDALAVKKGKWWRIAPIGWKKHKTKTGCRILPCDKEREQVEAMGALQFAGMGLRKIETYMRAVKRPRGGRSSRWNKNSIKMALIARAEGYPPDFVSDQVPLPPACVSSSLNFHDVLQSLGMKDTASTAV